LTFIFLREVETTNQIWVIPCYLATYGRWKFFVGGARDSAGSGQGPQRRWSDTLGDMMGIYNGQIK